MMHIVPFVLLCLVSFLGTVGNVFIIAAVCLRKKLRVRGNMFVVNLAVADLIVTAYIMPVGLMTSQYEVNPFGEVLCEFNAFLIMTTLGVSTQTLMMIGLERYIHICQTQYYDRILQPCVCGVLVAVCWIYATIWTCQGWTGWTYYIYGERLYVCIFHAGASLSYTLCLTFFGIILPMIVISICYYKIFKTVKLSRQNLRTITLNTSDDPVIKELQRKQKKKLRQEHRLVMTLFLIVVIFICFWLPTAFILPLSGVTSGMPGVLFPIAVWTSFANSSVNSLVYGVMNKNFRDGYKALFRYVCCCGRALCQGLASHVDQSKDEDTLTTSQQPPQPGSPTSSMTTVRTLASREGDTHQTGANGKHLPKDNLQVHNESRANNDVKDNGIKDNDIKDNDIKDNGINDNDIKDNGIKDNLLYPKANLQVNDAPRRSNDIKDHSIHDNDTKGNRRHSRGNLQVHDVSRATKNTKRPSHSSRTSKDNTAHLAPDQVYINDDLKYMNEGHWEANSRSPSEQNGELGLTEWNTPQRGEEMESLETFDFRRNTNGGGIQFYDGDLMMISKV